MNRHFIHKILFYLILTVLFLSACATPQASPTPIPPSVTPLPPTDIPTPTLAPPIVTPTPEILEGKVDIGGRGLYYTCLGEGSPIVVVDSGFARDHLDWLSVMRKVAPHTRICAYDRAGLGESDPTPTPRTSLDMANDLHALLTQAGIPGPYILAGHSLGGVNVLVYTHQYPDDVVGVVLVEPASPDYSKRVLESLPPESANEPYGFRECREKHMGLMETLWSWGEYDSGREVFDRLDSAGQVYSITSLGELPLVVITAEYQIDVCRLDPAKVEKQVWWDLHEEYAGLSTNGEHIFAEEAVQRKILGQEYQLIGDVILEIIEQVKSK